MVFFGVYLVSILFYMVLSGFYGFHNDMENIDPLDNVLVTPTSEQLRSNTTVEKLNEDHPDNCAICQDPMNKDQEVRTITYCNHMFHIDCIDTWLGRNIHCPCCRHDIRVT
jgi:hypothetical protein